MIECTCKDRPMLRERMVSMKSPHCTGIPSVQEGKVFNLQKVLDFNAIDEKWSGTIDYTTSSASEPVGPMWKTGSL